MALHTAHTPRTRIINVEEQKFERNMGSDEHEDVEAYDSDREDESDTSSAEDQAEASAAGDGVAGSAEEDPQAAIIARAESGSQE